MHSSLASIYLLSRAGLAAIFLYHGLVPKLIFESDQEVLMNDTLIPFVSRDFALLSSGIAEVALGVLLLLLYRNRLLVWVTLLFAVGVTAALLIELPSLFQDAFNPFSINLGVFLLGAINLIAGREGVRSN